MRWRTTTGWARPLGRATTTCARRPLVPLREAARDLAVVRAGTQLNAAANFRRVRLLLVGSAKVVGHLAFQGCFAICWRAIRFDRRHSSPLRGGSTMCFASLWVIAALMVTSSLPAGRRGARSAERRLTIGDRRFHQRRSSGVSANFHRWCRRNALAALRCKSTILASARRARAYLTVYNTSGGLPNSALGTVSLPSSGIPSGGYAFQSFDVSSYVIPVHVGDVLAYGVTSTLESRFLLAKYVRS